MSFRYQQILFCFGVFTKIECFLCVDEVSFRYQQFLFWVFGDMSYAKVLLTLSTKHVCIILTIGIVYK